MIEFELESVLNTKPSDFIFMDLYFNTLNLDIHGLKINFRYAPISRFVREELEQWRSWSSLSTDKTIWRRCNQSPCQAITRCCTGV